MDNELLLSLFKIPAPTRQEAGISDFIKDFLKKESVPFKEDGFGNIFNLTNPKAPLLSAHLDTVQDETDSALSKFIKIRDHFISGYGVIGGDDKCGLYIILELLKGGDKLNFVFSTGEESGGTGIRYFMKTQDISKLPYGLVLDRRGSDDIICTENEYGILDLENYLLRIGELFGYTKSSGTFSDADFISEQISCANLSVGYYSPHSKNEFVNTQELAVALNFTHSIIKNVERKFAAPRKKFSRSGFYELEGNVVDYSEYLKKEDDYQVCEECGSLVDDFVVMKRSRKLVCADCYNKIEADVLNLLDGESMEEIRSEREEFDEYFLEKR